MTDSRLDAIAKLWPRLTTKAIGAALGLTKNSVCGLVFKARKSGDPRFPIRTLPGLRARKKAWRPQEPARITELRAHQCRYPVRSGEEKGDHYFCGAERVKGSSYCAKHGALSIRPPMARVRAA